VLKVGSIGNVDDIDTNNTGNPFLGNVDDIDTNNTGNPFTGPPWGRRDGEGGFSLAVVAVEGRIAAHCMLWETESVRVCIRPPLLLLARCCSGSREAYSLFSSVSIRSVHCTLQWIDSKVLD
jgi:hypothetical protein